MYCIVLLQYSGDREVKLNFSCREEVFVASHLRVQTPSRFCHGNSELSQLFCRCRAVRGAGTCAHRARTGELTSYLVTVINCFLFFKRSIHRFSQVREN